MTQRTRYFLVSSALVMTVVLATGLVAFYNGNLPMVSSAAGPAELAYLPGETTAVAYANVRSIMDSDFRKKLKQVLPTGEAKDELFKETGIDLEKDIDTVVAGFTASPSKSMTMSGSGGLGAVGVATDNGAIALVRGRFNNANIETMATQHGATVETYKGKRLLVMGASGMKDSQPGTPAHAGGLAFLESGLLALGEVSAVKKAIDTAAARTDVTKNASLMKYVTEVQNSGNAWIVGKIDTMSNTAGLPDQVKNQVAGLEWFSVSARVNGGVNGVVRADAKDDASAENMRDVVRGGLAAGRMMAGQDPKLTAMLNALQLQGSGKTVAISFTIPPEMLDIINGLAAMGKNIKR